MPLETTETRVFEVREVGDMIKSPKGHTWVECVTDAGTVAFFGGKSISNLLKLQRRQPPFRVKCACRPPLPNYPTHAWWVPEEAVLEFIEGAAVAAPPAGAFESLTAPEPFTPEAPVAPPQPPVILPPPVTHGLGAPAPVAPPPEPPPARPTLVNLPAASPFKALAKEDTPLYVIGSTKTTVWDDDDGPATTFVPAIYAYRGRAVKDWLASSQRAQAAHWLFLSPRYGFIEPEHPVARHEGAISERSIPDAALKAQVEHERRWNDRVSLREFQTVYVWAESAGFEEKVRAAFEGLGAKVVKLKAVTKAK